MDVFRRNVIRVSVKRQGGRARRPLVCAAVGGCGNGAAMDEWNASFRICTMYHAYRVCVGTREMHALLVANCGTAGAPAAQDLGKEAV